jgi:glycosyltransferase involved in cell wall biosynthesis
MQKILFFETNDFTGATRVTRTLAKAAQKEYKIAFAAVGNHVKEDIESAITREKPDILFSSFIHINPDVILTGKDHSLKVIIRNDYNLEDVSREVRERAKATYPLADEIIAQTEQMRENLLNDLIIDSSKVKVIENPLDEEDILTKAKGPNPFPDNGCFHFLWVGRKDPVKDLATLQRAFDLMHAKCKKTDLTLVSNDPNPYLWMKYADCLIISSRSEASPNVLREALFLGTPVISTDCSQTVRQLLPPHRIVPVHEPEAMACAMLEMLRS